VGPVVVVAPDSFKEALEADKVAAAMARGVLAAWPQARCHLVPMSDGGEGLGRLLTAAWAGQTVKVPATNALGQPIVADLGWAPARQVAVVEVAQAVGLGLIPPSQRDVMRASSRGVGQLLAAGLDLVRPTLEKPASPAKTRPARPGRIVVGLGGSATNDGGAGLLQELGVHLADAAGRPLPPGAAALTTLARVDCSGLDPRWRQVEVELACDVANPLTGPHGATYVFGPQKGVGEDELSRLDQAIGHLAELLKAATGRPVAMAPGAGAAGGMAAALMACLGAQARPGVEVMAQATGLEELIAGARLVLTGEGSIDAQTAGGKTPWGVAELARRHHTEVWAFAGQVQLAGPSPFNRLEAISANEPNLAAAIGHTAINLERAVAAALLRHP